MAEQTQQTDIVAEFVKNLVPKELLETAQLLVSLTYPIFDRKSLIRQLETRKTQDPQGEKGVAALSRPLPKLIESAVDPFKPEDFGIESPDGALEKFFARTRQDLPGPRQRLNLPDLPPSIPERPAFSDPFFGPGPCGEAAAQLWEEHLDSRIARWVGPNPAYYRELQELAENCRRDWRLPFRSSPFGGLCTGQGNTAYARCVMAGGRESQCMEEGNRALNSCLDRIRHPF